MGGHRVIPPGVALWARIDVRRRLLSLVVLGVLAGLAGGLAMASVAGARRTDSAFGRLRATTRSADALVFPGQVGQVTADWEALRERPYVEAVAPWSLLFGSIDGEPGGLIFGALDDEWLQDVDQPIVLEGRAFDPDVPTEVVVDEYLATHEGLDVGSSFTMQFFEKESGDVDGGAPTGLTLELKVVGVVRTTARYLFTEGLVVSSPALISEYGDQILTVENASVRLRDPAAMPQLFREVSALLAPGTPVLDLQRVEARVSTAIDVERAALLLLGAAVAAAGLVFVGQALVRSVAAIDEDRPVLRAMGTTRRELTIAAALPHLLVAVVAMVVAVGSAIALSPRFPIGYTGTIDPGKGVHADWLVLLPGALLIAVAVVVGALVPAWRRGRTGPAEPASGSRLAARIRRSAPVPVGLGVTMALDPGRGRIPTPVRPALAAAAVGLLGVAATLTVNHSLTDSLAHPERAGVTWDATIDAGVGAVDLADDDQLDDAYLANVLAAPELADVTVAWRVVLEVDGIGLPALATVPQRGDIDLVVLDGEKPDEPDEVALGPATARVLGLDIGDEVAVGDRSLRVVGTALFPVEVHNGFDEGVWMSIATLRSVAPPTDTQTGDGPSPSFVFTWAPGVDPEQALPAVQEQIPDVFEIAEAEVPQELANLRNVRTVPVVLAGFLLFLAVASLLHALASSVRTRRRDLAVYRTLGFTRPMTIASVSVQGTTIVAFGLLVGLPTGVAIGRWAWAWVSDRVPLVFASPLILVALLIAIPSAVLVANLLAVLPARRAVRLRPAEVLRTE